MADPGGLGGLPPPPPRICWACQFPRTLTPPPPSRIPGACFNKHDGRPTGRRTILLCYLSIAEWSDARSDVRRAYWNTPWIRPWRHPCHFRSEQRPKYICCIYVNLFWAVTSFPQTKSLPKGNCQGIGNMLPLDDCTSRIPMDEAFCLTEYTVTYVMLCHVICYLNYIRWIRQLQPCFILY